MNKVLSILLTVTFLSGAILLSNNTSAESSTSNASVTVPEACTMTGSGMNSHTATITPGTFSASTGSDYENGIGKTTFTVICNDYNGFAIYAIGYTGDSYDDTNHTKLVGSNTNAAIDTAVYSSGDTTSSWSMKVNKVTDSTISYLPTNMSIQNSFDSWHTIPDTYTKVAQYKASTGSSTTDTTLGAKIDTTYAAFIAPNQPGDTYVGQVKYVMIHPYNETSLQPQSCPSGKICYFANTVTAEGTMGQQTVSTSATSATLLASNYSRTGYGFAGWSDKFDYTTNTNAKFYGPQEDITFTAGQYTGSNPGLSLYAVWVKSEGSLQDTAKVSQLCGTGTGSLETAPTDGTANLTSVSALTDQRDNETYAIAKLADGNCWMIENLRLESTNSDNSTGALAQGYGTSSIYSNFSGLADSEAPWANNSTTANSLYSTDGSNNTVNIGSGSEPGYRFPRYNNYNNQSTSANRPQDPTTNSATNSTTNAGMYSYGNYYTWHAAIADLTYNFANNSSVTSTSLCPSGWHLPKGGNKSNKANNEFWSLVVTGINGGTNPANYESSTQPYYTGTPEGSDASNSIRTYPNNFVYSGYVDSGLLNDRGSRGVYWSSSVYSSYSAYRLSLSSSYVYPGTGDSSKYYGRTLRCVAPGA